MGNNYMEPFTFNSARNFLGFLVLIPIVLIKLRKPEIFSGSNESFSIDKKITVIGGVCCGLALAAAGMFQQYGVKYTTVGKAGFITTLYIILTPIFGLLLGKKCHFTVWIGAVGAVVGLYMLCITESLSFSPGDILVLICAVLFAVHILLVDYFSPKTDGVLLSCIQFFVCGVLSALPALLTEPFAWADIRAAAMPILYTGVMSSGVAYTLQIVGQKYSDPTVASIIMSLESVFAALAGWALRGEQMSAQEILGCLLMFAAIVIAQLPERKKA
jgi:drug/metabolite transporter (DMT)-like permease